MNYQNMNANLMDSSRMSTTNNNMNMQMMMNMNMLSQFYMNNNMQVPMMNGIMNNNQMANYPSNDMDNINSILENKMQVIYGKESDKFSINENLLLFLNSVCFNNIRNEENHNNKNNKLILNYYNLIKVNIYLNLNSKIKELIPYIFWQIFYPSKKIFLNKRTEKTQTTEYIINNPISEPNLEFSINYQNFLFLEFNGKNLSSFLEKTGIEIGLKEGDEILLKLNKNFYDELNKSLKNWFYLDYDGQKRTFFFEENEIASKRIDKIFNRDKCFLIDSGVELKGDKKLINSINRNIILKEKSILMGEGELPVVDFIDVSTGKIKELKFNKNAPKWRIVNNGLNIFGICKNKKCEAFKKEVIYMTKLSSKGLVFNLNTEIPNIRCPICNCLIKIKTCGFYKCEYQFIGRKLDPGEDEEIYYDSKTKETNGDKFEYFDPMKSDEATWLELNIYVLPKQEIKYKEN